MLYLSNCKNLVTLPDSIYDLRSLEYLILPGCSNLEKFPKNLEALCSLVELDLSHCNLMEGSIPTDIWGLYSLEKLNLRGNHMVSILPASLNFVSFVTLISVTARCSKKFQSFHQVYQKYMPTIRSWKCYQVHHLYSGLPSSNGSNQQVMRYDFYLIMTLKNFHPPSSTPITY